MKAKFSPQIFLVFLLFLIGIILRIWNLNHFPISLFGDEIDAGLQAKSILETGKDYMGHPLPIIFRSFAEHRLPMQLYLTVPFIKIFGMNELGVRSASVMMGFLSIYGMYLLIKEIFGKRLATVSALLLLFSPWHFVLSRQANDSGFLLPFVIIGLFFLIKGFNNYKYLILSAIVWSLGIYSYATYSLFAPLFLISITILFFGKIKRIGLLKIIVSAIAGLVILLPYLNETFRGVTTQRFSYIRVLTQEEIEAKVIQGRRWSDGFWGKLFYNKLSIVGGELFKNYASAFSPVFLFSQGDPNLRHNIGDFGQIYVFEAISIIAGFYALSSYRSDKRKYIWVFFIWLFLAPIPSALTKDGGTHAPRLILMLPPLTLFSAIGLDKIFKNRILYLNKVILFLFTLLTLFNISSFMYKYFNVWPNESWRFWHYGFKQTLGYVKSIDSSYQEIYFNNTYEPMLPRFLFYYNYDMALFQKHFKGDVHIENLEKGFSGFSLGDKYFFGDLKKPIERLAQPGNLIVASGEKDVTNPLIFENPSLKLLEVITSPYNDSIFYVFTGS